MGEEEGGPYADPQPRGVCLRGWLRARAAQGERVGGPERLREGGHRELEPSQAEHCPPHGQVCLEPVNVTLFENRVSGVIKLRWGSPGLG